MILLADTKRAWSYCGLAQADWTFAVRICPKTRFRFARQMFACAVFTKPLTVLHLLMRNLTCLIALTQCWTCIWKGALSHYTEKEWIYHTYSFIWIRKSSANGYDMHYHSSLSEDSQAADLNALVLNRSGLRCCLWYKRFFSLMKLNGFSFMSSYCRTSFQLYFCTFWKGVCSKSKILYSLLEQICFL